MEITRFLRTDGEALSKRITLLEDGQINSDGSECRFTRGRARRFEITSLAQFARQLGATPSAEAIALGSIKAAYAGTPDDLEVVVAPVYAGMKDPAPHIITRSIAHFEYRAEPGLLLIDFDRKGCPDRVLARIDAAGGVWPLLCEVFPALKSGAHVYRPSTSSGLINVDTDEVYGGVGGGHYYLHVQDVSDSKRALYAMHDKLWREGLGWIWVSVAGSLLERALVDRTVGSPERLVFEGAPVVVAPLAQVERPAVVVDGDMADTREAFPDLAHGEKAVKEDMVAHAKNEIRAVAGTVKEAHIAKVAKETSKRTGAAVETVIAQMRVMYAKSSLLPHIELHFDDTDIGTVSAATVMLSPQTYVGQTLADPIEGVAYGRCKAKVLALEDGTLIINSFAHGGAVYRLVFDAAQLKTYIETSTLTGSELVKMAAMHAARTDLDPAERVEVIAAVAKKSGIGVQGVKASFKAARESEAVKRRKVQSNAGDLRKKFHAPPAEAPLNAVAEQLDSLLASVRAALPPTRGEHGQIVEVINRVPAGLHTLGDEDRPADPMPLLTIATPLRVQCVVEKSVFVFRMVEVAPDVWEEEENALPIPFAKSLMEYPESRMPVARGVSGLPLVTPSTEILMAAGLDRKTGIVFNVPSWIADLVPTARSTVEEARAAYQWLLDEWLCDVMTCEQGKAVAVAMALSIIERSWFEDRPGYSVRAAIRASGKTTLVSMISMAVLGSRAAASPWSREDEEQRKNLFAAALDDPALLCFDNVANGSIVSSPVLDLALTTGRVQDRILGSSVRPNARASSVYVITGNSFQFGGDLSSRMLHINIDPNRADPENRKFKHEDILGWTLSNRALILSALYTILMVERDQVGAGKTRFKRWWHMCGHPVEIVSGVDFGPMLRENVNEDPAMTGTINLFGLMRRRFPKDAADTAHGVVTKWVKTSDLLDIVREREQVAGSMWETCASEDSGAIVEALEVSSGTTFVVHPIPPKAISARMAKIVGRVADVPVAWAEDGTVLVVQACKLITQMDSRKGTHLYRLVEPIL